MNLFDKMMMIMMIKFTLDLSTIKENNNKIKMKE